MSPVKRGAAQRKAANRGMKLPTIFGLALLGLSIALFVGAWVYPLKVQNDSNPDVPE